MNPQKIAILTDSCTDVPGAFAAQHNIFIVPVRVIYREQEYIDRVNITPQEIYDRLETEVPHTSLPTSEDLRAALARIQSEGYEQVLAVSISSGLSGTANAMRMAAKEFPGLRFRLIDTLNIGIGAGLQAIYASKLVEQGFDMDEICRKLTLSVEHTKVFFCVATLEYLRKGGRIGRVASAVGTILNLKPIISCDEKGMYYVVAKARGRAKSISEAVSLALKQVRGDMRYCVAVANGNAREEAQRLMAELKAKLPDCSMFLESEVSPALCVHTGPGLLGICVQLIEK